MRERNIELVRGDITRMEVDAIVNAANSSLMGGGGVDGAIHKAGGPVIVEECLRIRQRQGGCPAGEAVITSGGRLPARFVIHAVGPVWEGGGKGEEGTLAAAYCNSLALAKKFGIDTIAFPNISTWAYGFPPEQAARVALEALSRCGQGFIRIYVVCFDEDQMKIWQEILTEADVRHS